VEYDIPTSKFIAQKKVNDSMRKPLELPNVVLTQDRIPDAKPCPDAILRLKEISCFCAT